MAQRISSGAKDTGHTFRYVAVNKQKKVVKGTVNAANEAVVGRLLMDKGLTPVTIQVSASRFSLEEMLPSFFAVKPQQVNVFSRQLATLIESGIPLLSALESIQQHMGSRPFKRVLSNIGDDLRTGISFSDALTKHPQVFNEIYCKTVATAEKSGKLEVILRQVADYQERQGMAMKKVKAALTYPAIILTLGVGVVIILMTTALPSLIKMFTQMNVALPLPTRMLIALTNFVNADKFYILAVVAVLAAAGIWYFRQPSGRLRIDRLTLRIPLIGPPLHSAEIGRFSRTASVLLAAGISLQEIMEMIPHTVGNRAMRQTLHRVGQGLIRGEGIARPMAAEDIFPPLLLQMVTVGEESNTLESTLQVAADFYEANAEDTITALVRIIQPASTVLIAGMVGFIALSVIMPMYSITGAF